jgi:hypothetical protein
LQLGYLAHLFSPNPDAVFAACAVGSHFVSHNLLHAIFIALFVRSHFVTAEAVLLLNFINLSALYFRHGTRPETTREALREAQEQQQQQPQEQQQQKQPTSSPSRCLYPPTGRVGPVGLDVCGFVLERRHHAAGT